MTPARVIAVLFLLAGVFFLGSVLLFSRSNLAYAPPQDTLDVLGEAPQIVLTAQSGDPFSSDALDGKVWVADFFFTSCAGPCPVMTQALAELQREFPTDPRVQFVSISVDPDTDTPEVLQAYAEKYEADPDRWHFLTGPIESIQDLAVEGFKVGSVDDPVIHSTRLILVDQQGQIRGYYIGIEPADVEELKNDIRLLLEERAA